MMLKKAELLSPAGNLEGFYGALRAGADAVYLGGTRFGARAYAENFTEEELLSCIRYAHILGRKVYLTVNTLIKNSEWPELEAFLLPVCKAGLDGVIVQDMGVLWYLKERFPSLALHASTQMTLTGTYGASYLKSLGVRRIVPSRELSLEEIRKIKEETGLEIEIFIHGAMCYCYSGQCLFSSILGRRSGNRGRCAQPCRLPYSVRMAGDNFPEGNFPRKVFSGKNFPVGKGGVKDSGFERYPLSLKDLCTIERLPDFLNVGLDSFKIEGRMKKPEYAAGVTAIYRKYLDRFYAHPEKPLNVAPKDKETLSKLYIRSELQDGYFDRHNGADMIALDNPAYCKTEETLLKDIRRRYLEHRPVLPIRIFAEFRCGQPARATFAYGKASVTVTGELVQKAANRPVTKENLLRQLGKLGDTPLEAKEIRIMLDADAFYPLKALNELRRRAVCALEEEILRIRGYHGTDGNRRTGAERNAEEIKTGTAERTRGIETEKNEEEIETGTVERIRESETEKNEEEIKTGTVERIRESEIEKNAEEIETGTVERIRESETEKNAEEIETGTAERNRESETGKNAEDNGIRRGNNMDGGPQNGLNVSLATIGQCRALAEMMAKKYVPFRIYIDADLLAGSDAAEAMAFLAGSAGAVEVFLTLPQILRARDSQYLEKIMAVLKKGSVSGCMVRSLEGYAYLKAHQYSGKIAADSCFYIWNSHALHYWRDKLDSFCLPLELNAGEQQDLLRAMDTEDNAGLKNPMENGIKIRAEKQIYGYLPMMVSANCVAKTTGHCLRTKKQGSKEDKKAQMYGGQTAVLTDRYQKNFPVRINCLHCMNTIYNSVPLSLHAALSKWKTRAYLRLDFTIEPEEETAGIFEYFYRLYTKGADKGCRPDPPYKEYTTAHESRLVE